MERRQAFVHVGPHKTGTTLLQNLLRHMEADLANAGRTIPDASVADSPGTAAVNHVALEIMGCVHHPWHGWPVPTHRVEALTQWLRQCEGSPVLSAEEFSRFTIRDIAVLRDLLSPALVVPVIGARRYDALSRSVWSQLLWAGVEVRSLSTFQRAFLDALLHADAAPATPRAVPALQQYRLPVLVETWQGLVEPRVITMAPRRAAAADDALLAESFLTALGIPTIPARPVESLITTESVNARPGPSVQLALLAINRAHRSESPVAFVAERHSALAQPLKDHDAGDEELARDPEIEDALRALFTLDMDGLRAQGSAL